VLGVFFISLLPPVAARQSLGALFGPMCIQVSDLAADSNYRTRNDLAELVRSAVQSKLDANRRTYGRRALVFPNCIRPDQPDFNHQLILELAVKRQELKLLNVNWNVIVVSEVSTNGLIQDRGVQPVMIEQQAPISDKQIVDALVELIDRTVLKKNTARLSILKIGGCHGGG
jgi:hypothetical protein